MLNKLSFDRACMHLYYEISWRQILAWNYNIWCAYVLIRYWHYVKISNRYLLKFSNGSLSLKNSHCRKLISICNKIERFFFYEKKHFYIQLIIPCVTDCQPHELSMDCFSASSDIWFWQLCLWNPFLCLSWNFCCICKIYFWNISNLENYKTIR